MKTIQEVIAGINEAKAAIKTGAVDARKAAPKGEKMAHGQHFAATHAAELAASGVELIGKHGFVPSAIAVKTSKTGKVEFTVAYRQAVSLEARVQTMKNAAARRKEKRDAAKAAAEAEAKAKIAPMPAQGAAPAAPTAAESALAAIDAALKKAS